MWTTIRPNRPGYYWVVFSKLMLPEIIYLDEFGAISVIGVDGFYFHGDVELWGEELERPNPPPRR